MLRNYYNLQLLVNELQHLAGFVIVDCFTQEKNVLHIICYDGNVEKVLQFSSDPILGSFFLKENFIRSKSNSVNLFNKMIGEQIQSIELIPKQRIIKIDTNNRIFFVQLFGGSQNNTFLCNKDLFILDAFKNRHKFLGKRYSIIDFENIERTCDLKVSTFLERKRFWGKFYTRIILENVGISLNEFLRTLGKEELQRIYQAEEQLIFELNNTKKFNLYLVDKEYVVSGVVCKWCEPIKILPSISQAFYHCYIETMRFSNFINRKKKLLSEIEKNIKLFESKIGNQKYISLSQTLSNQYSEWGNILLAQPNLKEKGLAELEITNFEGNSFIIPLKPELSIMENAEYFFSKSRKLRNQIENQRKMTELFSPKLEKLKQVHQELHKIDDYLTFKEFVMRNKDEIPELESQVQPTLETEFRRFELGNGFILYVGKNAKNNDMLTFRFARPNDYWFHARGVSGSHCILRCPSKKEPSKEILQKSAQIAAYYSKSSKSKTVAVSFTQRKYIRKLKGAEPGRVIMMREDVILVDPKLPKV
ncbi:MAG: NFACT RNA binding domain-containing protein [Candidatus Kapaibacteriales bacterium]